MNHNYISTRDAAATLGISQPTLRKLIKQLAIKRFTIGTDFRSLRINHDDFERLSSYVNGPRIVED